MRINGSPFEPLRPDRAPSGTDHGDARPAQPPGAPAASPVPKSDSVQISAAGRSLAERVEREGEATMAPERVAELRTKVLRGAYNTLDVVDQVARRVLSSGDL